MAKRIRIRESELVNLIRRTIKETQVLNEEVNWSYDENGCHCLLSNGHQVGQDCDEVNCAKCCKWKEAETPTRTTTKGGKRGTKSSSGSRGNDMSRIGAREVGEGQDYHGSHAGGYGAASSRTALSEGPYCPDGCGDCECTHMGCDCSELWADWDDILVNNPTGGGGRDVRGTK